MAYQIEKAEKREKKRNKTKNGMRISGRSVILIQEVIINRAEKAKNKKKGK